MSVKRMTVLLTEEISVDGQALDPAILTIAFQILTTLVNACKGTTSTTKIARSVRAPSPGMRRKFRENLREELGEEEYKARGSHRYAGKMFRAAARLKANEAISLVKEVAS